LNPASEGNYCSGGGICLSGNCTPLIFACVLWNGGPLYQIKPNGGQSLYDACGCEGNTLVYSWSDNTPHTKACSQCLTGSFPFDPDATAICLGQ
jgi:hypothetical protein